MVKVLVLKTAGTNCDYETCHAFEAVGTQARTVHINRLLGGVEKLMDHDILVIPGGFTYGDDTGSGKILANQLRFKLRDEVEGFVSAGKLIIGICNGFQVLVKAGLLPAVSARWELEATLTFNDSGKFEDRWVYLKNEPGTKCVFTKGIDMIYLPVAHGEGKFIAPRSVIEKMKENNQVVFTYTGANGNPAGYPFNPNGSMEGIAGVCDPSGRVFGLMPHPERHFHPASHPRWTREGLKAEGDGVVVFRNAVEHFK